MAWPWNKQGIASPNLNVPQDQQQYFSGTDWRSQMQPMNAGWSNTSQAPNTLEQDIQNVASNTSQEEFDSLDDNPLFQDTTKYMRQDGEPYFAENWNKGDIFNRDTTLGGYQKHPSGDQWNNKDKWLRDNPQGLAATDQAQKKPFINWDAFPSPMNAMKAMMGAVKDSPQEKFNRETFSTYEGGPMENRIYEHPASSVFGNKNVSSIFGGLDTGGQKRIDSLSKAIAKMEGPEGDATKGKWSKLYQGDKDDRAEYERRLNALRERKIAFTNQLKQYNADLVAKGIKEKAAADQAVAAAPKQIAPQHHQEQGGGGYRDAPIRSAAAAMSKGIDVGAGGMMGPGGRHYAYGGRAGYANGDMVAQETDFIEGPQGGEEFQETVVQGQEQPSREQLEALAMHIFQLPLDDLDEQQLVVVYQAAMQGQPMEENFQENIQFADQGQPMEESVQEEDVQFAAQGGLAGLL